MILEAFQFLFLAPGDDMLHWLGGIWAVMLSKLLQDTHPNSERYHPSWPKRKRHI